jgi:hypothetical protein
LVEFDDGLIDWLLEGDVSIQYQVHRDLLDDERPELRDRISKEGWGAEFLARRGGNGHWGRGFYMPKWTSTHYTLLDLKNLGISPDTEAARETIDLILGEKKGVDGGVNPSRTIRESDVCINGMLLNYACYFGVPQEQIRSVVDFLIDVQMGDGGFNCRSNRGGAVHSSLHSTLSVLEGLHEYLSKGYGYRASELEVITLESVAFILMHKLFRSDHTNKIIDRKMLMLSYPSRWRYDILRALDYFQVAGITFDPRMQEALDVLRKKKRRDGRWPLQARHPGASHFEMEQAGGPSRWNTLRALRVLRHFN